MKNLYCIYRIAPEQIVLLLNGERVVTEYRTKTPPCSFGAPRGGTQPVPYQGMWLRFFHSQSINQPDRSKWLYHIGALIMESSPPFQVMAVSKWPILSGREHPYINGHRFFKPRIVFPAGVLENAGGWDVALGINDSLCATVHVKPEQLNL